MRDDMKCKKADLIVVDGNPLEDVQSVRRLAMVMKAGRVSPIGA
jgi:imidazolonepropionase-like amidohydrolase